MFAGLFLYGRRLSVCALSKRARTRYYCVNQMAKIINVAIVDDCEEDRSNCLALLTRYGEERDVEFRCSLYETGDDFLMHFKSQFDFIVLDINLLASNGIDIAHKIRETDEEVIIMFATNLAKYATYGYEVDAIDFVLKPLQYNSFALKLERVMKRLGRRIEDDISIKDGASITRVKVSDIYYLEVFTHDIVFHLGDRELRTRGSLKKYESELAKYYFLRCNSCYLVSAEKIRKVNKYDLELIDGTMLTISHPRKKAFLADFRRYLAKEGA